MRLAVALIAAVALTGCGLQPQDRPEVVPNTEMATTTGTRTPGAPTSPAPGHRLAGIYLLRQDRLVLVHRSVPKTADVEHIVSQLADGPTTAEAADGLRTAVLPGPIRVGVAGPSADVTVSSALTQLAGTDQLHAFAQVVWTVTEHSTATTVRVLVSGQRIRVPTDMGLVSRPVSRADFSSVAPLR